MGYALAAAAHDRRASVVLVTGPTSLAEPAGVETVRVTTAAEMHQEVVARAATVDVVIMAAAVADYAPVSVASQKIHKHEDSLTVKFERTPDIIGELGRRRGDDERPVLVAFAAETEHLLEQAKTKLREKRVDLVVANDVSRKDAGFEADSNEVTLVSHQGEELIPLQSKIAVAGRVLDRIESLLAARTPAHK